MTISLTSGPREQTVRAVAQEATTRESMQIRTTQNLRTLPVVLASLIALEFTFWDRINPLYFNVWAIFLATASIGRALLCNHIRKRLPSASPATLDVYETWLYISAIINGVAVGSCFWLVAAFGDLTVRMVMTLISCFYAIGALVNASSHFKSFAVVTVINLGQGVLFWLGAGSANPMQLEVAFPYAAVTILIISFGFEHSKQFARSVEIRTQNDALVTALAAEKKLVERALEEARLASESKSRFLAAASHDLRQPLHALTMFLGTLSFHVSTDDAKRILTRIKDTAQILEEQFNSLLDLSKFDAGIIATEINNLDLRPALEKLVEQFRPEAQSKNIELIVKLDSVMVHSDAMLLERALRNLIGNAIKYTNIGSVTIAASRAEQDVVIEVTDTGPGIPEDQQSRIFEEYVQLGNPARQRRLGVGLGLAIVKRIDALLNTRLALVSTVGYGTTFRLLVPISESMHATTVAKIPTLDTSDFRFDGAIWVLDDDVNVLDALTEQLRAWGATVSAFSDPSELLLQLRNGVAPPRWILTDDMLGAALSGLETAQLLSSEFGYGKVCLITGNLEAGRQSELRASGFPVIIKPARPELLAAILSQ